jgi:hypothetical protein
MSLSENIIRMRAQARHIDTLARRATPEFQARVRAKRAKYKRDARKRNAQESSEARASREARSVAREMRARDRQELKAEWHEPTEAELDAYCVKLWEAERLARELL